MGLTTVRFSKVKAVRWHSDLSYLTSAKLEGILAVMAPPKSSVCSKAVVMI